MQVKYRNFTFDRLLFSLKFVSLSYDSIISSHVMTESFIIIPKYFSFLQHVAG